MMNEKQKTENRERGAAQRVLPGGFTIFFAMLISSLALAVGLAIFDLTVRELELSGTATQSQYAIYAADTGADCALYWDLKYTDSDGSAFGTSTASSWPSGGSNILCNGQDISSLWGTPQKTSNSATTTFTIYVSAQSEVSGTTTCATVDVGKFTNGSGVLYTTVISSGYNTCSAASIVRVQRTLQISY